MQNALIAALRRGTAAEDSGRGRGVLSLLHALENCQDTRARLHSFLESPAVSPWWKPNKEKEAPQTSRKGTQTFPRSTAVHGDRWNGFSLYFDPRRHKQTASTDGENQPSAEAELETKTGSEVRASGRFYGYRRSIYKVQSSKETNKKEATGLPLKHRGEVELQPFIRLLLQPFLPPPDKY